MKNENKYVEITEEDLSFIEGKLSQNSICQTLHNLARKIAFEKNASQLNQEVKKYNPDCKYEVGDLIYKEYDEALMVNSKTHEDFKGAIVLGVINKTVYEDFNCEMLEVDYTGGGIFRKYIDYMKKTKTQVLLPSNFEKKSLTSEILKKEEDPRLKELPMTEKDLKTLEKNLKTVLSKSPKYFNWNDYWQLTKKQVKIPESKIKKIEKYFHESKQAVSTMDLVTKFFELQPSSEMFDVYCLSLNYILEKKYKKKFIFVSHDNWGHWFLKDILDSYLENLPLIRPKVALPTFDEENIEEATQLQNFPLKIYLAWREILSGGVRIPKDLNKELSLTRRYIFTDADKNKDYTVYYYPSLCIFLGLKEFYEENNVSQGASLTLEKKDTSHFRFGLKMSKKKLSVSKLSYDYKEDKFSEGEQEISTFSLPNKIIYLETETLHKLFSLYSQRDDLDLRELMILIFKNFGVGIKNLSLHYQRAFHLVDMLKHTTLEDVEYTLLSSPEFVRSEKNPGIFFYQEKIKTEEEIKSEKPVEITPELTQEEDVERDDEEMLPEIGTVGEIQPPEPVEEPEVEIPVEPTVKPAEEIKKEKEAPRLGKEKPPKKKRHKIKTEGEKDLRRRKGEKKYIEERIVFEESEQEAFFALKTKEKEVTEEKIEIPKKEKKKELKPPVSAESISGVFGEKLKSALGKTKKEKKVKK